MQKILFGSFCFFFFSFFVKAETDDKYEKRIYNIYLKHYKEPVSYSDWNHQIQSLPKNYKLKFRDNLWDLSNQFFKNSLYWSKLWVANPQVQNPHLIYKDHDLNIKSDIKSLTRVNSSKYGVDVLAQFPGLEIPEQEFSQGALKESEFPSSLPYLLIFHDSGYEINIGDLKNLDIDKETIVPFYITDQPPSSDGEVLSKDGYGEGIGVNAEKIVVGIDSEVSIGDTFTVFANKGKVGNFLKSFIGTNAEEIIIKGKIKILSYLPENSLYLASINQALQKIHSGDLLTKGEPQVYNFSRQGEVTNKGMGTIIGNPNQEQLMGFSSIVYLDKGLSSEIQAGNIFYIKARNKKVFGIKRPYKYDFPVIGKLKIIHSSTNHSTGIVINSRDPIYVGDIFSGQSDRLKDLGQSLDHTESSILNRENPILNTEEQKPPDTEYIEDYDRLDRGQDLLIDYEEIEDFEKEDSEDLDDKVHENFLEKNMDKESKSDEALTEEFEDLNQEKDLEEKI